ncbi:MAG: transcriptional regulator, family with cupin sensor [Bacteriovoracaceae bacterium]|nr:transcriptional regulator, family with cupin sensor [Bacteriovoracaceae bacterium]
MADREKLGGSSFCPLCAKDNSTYMKYLALGSRIRTIREKKKLSLDQVSKKAGIAIEQLKGIESDQEQPIIATLILLSKALGVNVADIFRDRPTTSSYEVVRSEGREKIKPLMKPTRAHILDYNYELLTTPGNDKHLNAYLLDFPARQSKRPTHDITHAGEEFIHMLDGEIVAFVAGDTIALKAGDSLFFRSTEPHTFFNPYEKIARAIAVVYPF